MTSAAKSSHDKLMRDFLLSYAESARNVHEGPTAAVRELLCMAATMYGVQVWSQMPPDMRVEGFVALCAEVTSFLAETAVEMSLGGES